MKSRVEHNGVTSNGFGISGRVAGIDVAAGIGIYGAALSFYDLWLARGHNVALEENTPIENTTTPGREPLRLPVLQQPAR